MAVYVVLRSGKELTYANANKISPMVEHGVQIMTPAYEGDPATPKIVARDQWYAPPAAMEPADPGNGHTQPLTPGPRADAKAR